MTHTLKHTRKGPRMVVMQLGLHLLLPLPAKAMAVEAMAMVRRTTATISRAAPASVRA